MTTTTTRRGAFELEPGLFFFAMYDGQNVYRIGHCGTTITCMACDGDGYVEGGVACGSCDATGTVRKGSPCRGHPTAEEARQHFREFLADKAWKKELQEKGETCHAAGCRKKSTFVMDSGFDDTALPYCTKHCTRDQYLSDLAEIEVTS